MCKPLEIRDAAYIVWRSLLERRFRSTLNWRTLVANLTHKAIKRTADLILASLALILLSPVVAVIAMLIRREDGGAVFYRALRVGRLGVPFRMYKFRTMVVNADRLGGPSTAGDDPRVTRIGQRIRHYKLDEIPQLLNVVRGEMSLVGPRPEVQLYVDMYTADERLILSVKPGITDWASIRYRNEGEILRGSNDPERDYLEKIRPGKIRLGLEYVRRQSVWTDFGILAQTVRALFTPARSGE
jgi:lipopolysaccharide/colanic/teichoic acid biosynthesis glycosyltransferase